MRDGVVEREKEREREEEIFRYLRESEEEKP